MREYRKFLLVGLVLLMGCSLEGPEERAIRQMVETFVVSIQQQDDDLAYACLLDLNSFEILNPDVSARVDAESFVASVMAELIGEYREMKSSFGGKEIKLKRFRLGTPFYHYKGHSAFQGNKAIIDVEGVEYSLLIDKIVRVGDKWRIVELSGNDF